MNFSTDSPCLSSTTLKTERLYLQEKCYVIVKFIVLFKYVIFVYIDNFIALQLLFRNKNVNDNVPKGFNSAVRKVFELYISKLFEVSEKIESPLQREIQMFFYRTDIVKTCPDMKKMVADLSERGKCVPTQYHLGTIRMLHWRFEAETKAVCSWEWSGQNIPFYVACPKPNNWALAHVPHASTLK